MARHKSGISKVEEDSQDQSPHVGEDGRIEGTDEWIADRILDETSKDYLMKWEGVNPDTGRPWIPTWEPKKYSVGEALLSQWKQEKANDPRILGRGPSLVREAKEADRIAALIAKNAAASGSGRKVRVAKKEKERSSTVSTDVVSTRSRNGTKEKRKRDSTVSTDIPPPPAKRRGNGARGIGLKANSIDVDSSESGEGHRLGTPSPSSGLTSEASSSERPKRIIAPSIKAKENAELAAAGNKAASTSRLAPSPTRSGPSNSTKPNKSASAIKSASRSAPEILNGSVKPETTTEAPIPASPSFVSVVDHGASADKMIEDMMEEQEEILISLQRSQLPPPDDPSSPTPPTSPESATRRPPGRTSGAKKRYMGPIPQLDPDVFQPHLSDKGGIGPANGGNNSKDSAHIDSPAQHHATQSTNTTQPSQADPIAQFSSPARSAAHSAPRRLADAPAVTPPRSIQLALEPSIEISPGQRKAITEKRIIDGTEITVLIRSESDSSFDRDSEATISLDGQQGDEEDATDGDNQHGELVDGLMPSTSAVDMEAVEVSVAESTVLERPPTDRSGGTVERAYGVTLAVVKMEPDGAGDPTPTAQSDADRTVGKPALQGRASQTTPLLAREPTETQIAGTEEQIDARPLPPAVAVIEATTKEMIIEQTVSRIAPTTAIARSAHLLGRNSRATSRTSEIRSRNASPSDNSESSTKEASPSLMQSLLDEMAVKSEDIDRLRSRLNSEVENNRVFREQLDKAHSVIGEMRQTQRENKSQITLLQEQLKNGLAQQRLFVLSVQKRRDEEVAQLRAQNQFLLQQARQTDDVVRNRAARFPALRKEHDQCAGRYQASEERVVGLQQRNNELSEQIALMRAQQMGVMEGEDASDSGESDLSSPYSSDYGQRSVRPKQKSALQIADKDVLSPKDRIKRCAFADIGAGCDLIFTDDEAHLQHILDHKARLGKDPFPVTISSHPSDYA